MSDSFEETPQKHTDEDQQQGPEETEQVPAAATDPDENPHAEPAEAPVEDPAPERSQTHHDADDSMPANVTASDDGRAPHTNDDTGYSETDPSSPEREARNEEPAAMKASGSRNVSAAEGPRSIAAPVGSATNAARSHGGATTPSGQSRGGHHHSVRSDHGGYSPGRSQAGSRAGDHSANRSQRPPLVASVSYPSRQEGLTVADFLDPSKPLVKSTQPLTKPRGPSFAEESSADARKQAHAERRMQTAIMSSQILAQRNNERKYLKAQYEFEREKKIAERAIYHKERCMQWTQRLNANPLGVDLVADNERIEEEAYIREKEERHRKSVAERRKQRIKRAIIVKALAEVPLLEKARKEKRELVEGEKREKALRDVQRVEAIQQRKLLDQELMARERQAKLDQRMMSSTANAAAGQRSGSVSR